MKIEFCGFYLSFDWHGFYFELGRLDPPTPFFTIALTLDWWKEFS
jgi:hypothetical protein